MNPINPAVALSPEEHAHGAQGDVTREYTILVVDDNEMNRDLMSIQFRRVGYKVITADGGYRALELIDEQLFDLVLLDIMMPGINGLEVLERVRQKHTLLSLPIIMVTADDGQQSIVNALQLGANDYLTKPLSLQVAMARIKTQLALRDLAALKDEFVRFASHDLKKPLIVMLDIADALKKDCTPGQPVKADTPELIDLMTRTGKNMQDVIKGFLNIDSSPGKLPEPEYAHIVLNDIVRKAAKINENYARQKGVVLQYDLKKNLPEVNADEFRILQVLDNLIGNAMKFSPRDTVTTVRTRADENYVYAEVSDGGPGLTEEDMQKLFTRYAKLSARPTGNETSTGIGLSMSKQFIDLHNGRIGAKNNPQHGTTFWFALPIQR